MSKPTPLSGFPELLPEDQDRIEWRPQFVRYGREKLIL